jgi:hypothetical protein
MRFSTTWPAPPLQAIRNVPGIWLRFDTAAQATEALGKVYAQRILACYLPKGSDGSPRR